MSVFLDHITQFLNTVVHIFSFIILKCCIKYLTCMNDCAALSTVLYYYPRLCCLNPGNQIIRDAIHVAGFSVEVIMPDGHRREK